MSLNRSQQLQIRLETPKQTYSAGEPIIVTLVLKNQSNSPVTVNKRMGINPKNMAPGSWEVKFDVKFPPGERLITATLINRGEPTKNDFLELRPGQEIRKNYTMSDFYWMELAGEYKVKATYYNSADGSKFGLSAWIGQIESNAASLTVTK